MSNQEVIDYCRCQIAETGGDLQLVAETLMDFCLAPDCDLGSVGCDNMTVVIVALLRRGQTYADWVEKLSQSVAKSGIKIDASTSVAARAKNVSGTGLLSNYLSAVPATEDTQTSADDQEIDGNY